MVNTASASQSHRNRAQVAPLHKESCRAKSEKLAQAIAEARNVLTDKVQTIAKENGRTEQWVKKQLYIASTAQKRAPNAWNGFIKGQLELYNSTRAAGSRVKLADFLASEEGKKVKAEWDTLPEEEKTIYIDEIDTMRAGRCAIVRENPRSTLADVNNTFHSMENEWMAIENRTGGQGFYVYVRQSLQQIHAPKIHYTQAIEKFFKDTLNLEPEEFALRLESYLVGGQARVKQSAARPLTQLISNCRMLIQDGLNHILQQEKIADQVPMNYDNYELKIVEEFGVELKGWPDGSVRNPGKLGGRIPVMRLLTALKDGSCSWVKLDPDALEVRIRRNQQLAASGKSVYKARKKASQPRKAGPSQPKSREIIADSDDGSGSGSGSE